MAAVNDVNRIRPSESLMVFINLKVVYGAWFMYVVISVRRWCSSSHTTYLRQQSPMFPFSIPCGAVAIYLFLTSFDRPLKRSWSCEAEQWIMLHLPSVGVHNLGQWGPSTYGCCRKFYVIIGSDRSTRWILGKWIDIQGKAEGDRERRGKGGRERERIKNEEMFLPSLVLLSKPNRHMGYFYKFMEFSVPLGACWWWDSLEGYKLPAKHSQNNSDPDQPAPGLDDTSSNSSLIVSAWIFFPSCTFLGLLFSYKGRSLDKTDVGMRLLCFESYPLSNWALSLTPRKGF